MCVLYLSGFPHGSLFLIPGEEQGPPGLRPSAPGFISLSSKVTVQSREAPPNGLSLRHRRSHVGGNPGLPGAQDQAPSPHGPGLPGFACWSSVSLSAGSSEGFEGDTGQPGQSGDLGGNGESRVSGRHASHRCVFCLALVVSGPGWPQWGADKDTGPGGRGPCRCGSGWPPPSACVFLSGAWKSSPGPEAVLGPVLSLDPLGSSYPNGDGNIDAPRSFPSSCCSSHGSLTGALSESTSQRS